MHKNRGKQTSTNINRNIKKELVFHSAKCKNLRIGGSSGQWVVLGVGGVVFGAVATSLAFPPLKWEK